MIVPIDPEGKSPDIRKYLNEVIVPALEALEQNRAYPRGGLRNQEIPQRPTWSQAHPTGENQGKWEPHPLLPGYFKDPNGIAQNPKKGEVPRAILEEFNQLTDDDDDQETDTAENL